MKSFSEFFEETHYHDTVWHGTRTPFIGKFDENKIGTSNDVGYSGRGFYFFPSKEDVKVSIGHGYMKPFILNLSNPFNLNDDDIFSNEPDDIPYTQYRDEQTLRLLRDGYDGSIRMLNGRIDEICVFSYEQYGFDGNSKISQLPDSKWIKF